MENYSHIPTICIVGRPNVGKSSLFNRLLGERRAVVVERSGTTRDRVAAFLSVGKADAKLVDTGGYVEDDKDELTLQIKEQIYRAMEEAAVVLLVTDVISGITPADLEIAAMLRKFSKPVLLVANKADNEKLKNETVEFFQLGFGDPLPVSCLHGRGMRDLKKRLFESIAKSVSKEGGTWQEHCMKIAVVGRPNVGKSSFVNNLLKRERVIVSEIPGTTRDSIDTYFSYEGNKYILVDTAGIRHRRKIKSAADTYSIMRSKESIKKADVVMLLLEAAEGVTKDDLGILDIIEENGKACLMLVNKWDLAKKAGGITMEDYEKHLDYASSRISKFPLSFISAKTGRNVLNTLSLARVLDANLDLKISTPYLNRLFEKNDPSNVPVSRRKERPKFRYIVQSSQRPMEFIYFVSDPSGVLTAHLSYIENQLRSNLPLKGIPIKINIRRSRKERK